MFIVYQSKEKILVTTKENEQQFLVNEFGEDLSKVAQFQRYETDAEDTGVVISAETEIGFYTSYD